MFSRREPQRERTLAILVRKAEITERNHIHTNHHIVLTRTLLTNRG